MGMLAADFRVIDVRAVMMLSNRRPSCPEVIVHEPSALVCGGLWLSLDQSS